MKSDLHEVELNLMLEAAAVDGFSSCCQRSTHYAQLNLSSDIQMDILHCICKYERLGLTLVPDLFNL
jgi:hypothetical protein